MSVDVSPDGRTILFDLLGDIYSVGIAGGKAERVTRGRRSTTRRATRRTARRSSSAATAAAT